MVHRNNFEAVNRCLCNIIGNDAPCGGRVFICCSDFRQIPPVLPGGGKSTIVQASIRSSSLWKNFELRNLTRLQRDAGDADHSRFIDRIGDGEVDSTYSVDGDTQLMKLEPMAVTTSEEEAIQFVFPDVNNTELCSERAIIAGRNAVVDDLNSKILKRMDGREVMLHSVTRLAPEDHTHLGHFLTEEFLHSLTSPGRITN